MTDPALEVADEVPPRAAMFLLYDTQLPQEQQDALLAACEFAARPWSERDNLPVRARVLACLSDEQFRDLTPLALERQWEIGVLPHPAAPHACGSMGAQGELSALVAHYRDSPVIEADVITCNGELVFSSVVLGKVLTLRPYDINRPQTRWSTFRGALRGLTQLRLSPYRLTTGKDRKLELAALGMLVVGHNRSSLVGRRFSGDLGINDGRVTLLALAPRSVLNYLWFVLRLLWPPRIQLSRLPASLGLVQSGHLSIEAMQGGVEYLLDGKPVHAQSVEFQVLEQRMSLLPGPALAANAALVATREKDTVRMDNVPTNGGARALSDKPLPMFRHASEEEYRELFVSLRDNARATSTFQVLMILSALLALSGLYANSAPVIIGAMILAPLMSPIVSLAMGLARTDSSLIRGALRTLGIGVAWGLLCAILMAWSIPLETATPEMMSRMSPTLLDLMVAVISGVAGAYAASNESVAKSLAGVAIAVALVPPLCVAGIGLGWGHWEMAEGAALLLITNLVGIALAASMTFLVLGFAPFGRARKGLGVTAVIMAVIAIPLYIAFDHLVERDWISNHVPRGQVELLGELVEVSNVRVTLGDPHLVQLDLSAAHPIQGKQLSKLKELIEAQVGEAVLVEAQISLRR